MLLFSLELPVSYYLEEFDQSHVARVSIPLGTFGTHFVWAEGTRSFMEVYAKEIGSEPDSKTECFESMPALPGPRDSAFSFLNLPLTHYQAVNLPLTVHPNLDIGNMGKLRIGSFGYNFVRVNFDKVPTLRLSQSIWDEQFKTVSFGGLRIPTAVSTTANGFPRTSITIRDMVKFALENARDAHATAQHLA